MSENQKPIGENASAIKEDSQTTCFRPIPIRGATVASMIIADRRGEDALDTRLLEAKLALGLILSEDMPTFAIEALDAGHDGTALRRLAGLARPDGWETDRWLPGVYEEMGMHRVDKKTAALRLAQHLAKQILTSNSDPLLHVESFYRYWLEADCPTELNTLGNLDDYLAWQSQDEVRTLASNEMRDLAGRTFE